MLDFDIFQDDQFLPVDTSLCLTAPVGLSPKHQDVSSYLSIRPLARFCKLSVVRVMTPNEQMQLQSLGELVDDQLNTWAAKMLLFGELSYSL